MQDDPTTSVSSEERNHLSGQLATFLSMIMVRTKGLPGPEANREAANQANRIESNSFAGAATATAYRDDIIAKISTLKRKLGISDNPPQQPMQEASSGNRQMADLSDAYGDPSHRDPREAPTAQQHMEMFQQHTRSAQAKGLGTTHNNYEPHSGLSHPQSISQGHQAHYQQSSHPQHTDSSGQLYSQSGYQDQEMHSSMRAMPGANGPMNYSHVSSAPSQAQIQLHRQMMASAQAKRPVANGSGIVNLQQGPINHNSRPIAANQQGSHPGTVKLGSNNQPPLTQNAPGTTNFARTGPMSNASNGVPSGHPSQVAHPQHRGMHQVPYHQMQAMGTGGMNQQDLNQPPRSQPVHSHLTNPSNLHQPSSSTVASQSSSGDHSMGGGPQSVGVRRSVLNPSAFPTATLKAKWAILAEQMPKVSNLPAQWKVLGQKYRPDADPMTDLTPDDLHALASFADLHTKQELQRRAQVQQQQHQQHHLQQNNFNNPTHLGSSISGHPSNTGAPKGMHTSSANMGHPGSIPTAHMDHNNGATSASGHLLTMAPGVPLVGRPSNASNLSNNASSSSNPSAGVQMGDPSRNVSHLQTSHNHMATKPSGPSNTHTATNLPSAATAKATQARQRQNSGATSQSVSGHSTASGNVARPVNGANSTAASGAVASGASAAYNASTTPRTVSSTAGASASTVANSAHPAVGVGAGSVGANAGAQSTSQGNARAGGAGNVPGAAIPTAMPLEKARETLLNVLPALRELSRIRTLSSRVREFLGGLTPSPVDQLPALLPDSPWWERPKRKFPTDNTKSGDSHLISANIIQLKRQKLKETVNTPSSSSNPSGPIHANFTSSSNISVVSETDSALIRTMRDAQSLRDEITLICGMDHFFSIQSLQVDLALILPSVPPFFGSQITDCNACATSHGNLDQQNSSNDPKLFLANGTSYSHNTPSIHSNRDQQSSSMSTDTESTTVARSTQNQIGVSLSSSNSSCSCPSHLFAHNISPKPSHPICALGLVLDMRYPHSFGNFGEVGSPQVIPSFSVRGCHFSKTFAYHLQRLNIEVKPSLNPRQYVKLVLERWKSWLQALSQMEADLRNPIFHNVTFRETPRKTSTLKPVIPTSLMQRPFGVNGTTRIKRHSFSYMKANASTETEFGITFSSEGMPDLFVVLPIDYPINPIQIIGLDTDDVALKEQIFNARYSAQSQTLVDILRTWMALTNNNFPSSRDHLSLWSHR